MILREAEDSPSAGGLEEFGDRLYFLVSLWPPGAFEPRVRYLVSGNPGNWELEEVDCTGYTAALELTSQSTPAILSCVGPFMDYDLTFSEKVGGSWQAQAIVEGLELPTGTFAFARDDVPFVAYKFRYWEPEETVDIRFARRVNGQWLHGVLDDAGGPGGYADRPIMRLDPDGNPAVAYRVEVGNDPWGNLLYEYRLARWNPETEDWDKQVVKPLGDFRFDPEGRLCLISGGYGSEPDTIALIYARLNGDTWEEDVIEEWPTGEKQPQGYDLAYDALGNPIVAYDSSGYRLFVAWSNGDNWEVAQVASGSGMFADLLVTEKGTPCLVYADDDTKEVILARYE